MQPLDPTVPESCPEFEVHLTENVPVSMRDGVRLATDVYRPARAGRPLPDPRPVLLHRTPYNKTETEATLGQGRWFAARGYVVVNQDCRGCFHSEGEVDFLIPEAEDGADTIAWIRQQAWANGTVGSFGTSWSGWTQTAMAALQPEGLATMVPNMSGADAHESSVRHGGALELRFLAWAFWHSAYNSQAALTARSFVTPALNLGAPPFSDWLERMPIRPGQTQLALVPPYEKWAFEILTRADYDDYWRHPSLNPRAHWDRFANMPILFVGGWYDSYTRATFQNFAGLRAGGRRPVRALVGPWTHGAKTVEVSHAGDVEFGREAALPSFDELHLRWFDRWLRGVDNGLDAEAPLRIFVMGGGSGRRSGAGRLVHGGRWRDESEWPLARTRFTDFYLHGDGSLRAEPPRAPHSATTYRFDPAHPVPSIGGNVSSLRDVLPLPAGLADPGYAGRAERTEDIMRPGGFDQREGPAFYGCQPPYLPLGSRPDVLVFQTETLLEATEVTGPLEVVLWVATSAVDTDFTAKLVDVYPPSPWYPLGYALNLTDSVARLRYRNSRERGEAAIPGVPVQVSITLYPTSNLFMPGHRIRLDISSSNYPRFDVNPNTGEPIGRERRRLVADNTVFHEQAHPSRLILPIIPLNPAHPRHRERGGAMSSLEVHDRGLHDLIAPDASIERIAGGLTFTEGPLWRGRELLFSDIPNQRIVRWRRLPEGPELTTYARGMSNGLTLDRQGHVLAAEHNGRRVTRVAPDGARTVLAERFQGKRLNSPNDLVVKSDGAIYFTDPPYGVQPSAAGVPRPEGWWTRPIPGKEQPCHGVYRIAPDGSVNLVVDDFALPNGLAFSPDESLLYIDDSAHKHIRAFTVRPDGTLTNGRLLLDMASADPGVPDGLKVDRSGNVFCTGPGGVWVCRPAGGLLGRIVLPELAANLAWGEDGSVLFLTARTSVYRLATKTRGTLLG